jgi:hypothetical protein
MNEPTLFDVFKTVFTRPRVLRVGLFLAALFLAYQGALGLFNTPDPEGASSTAPLGLLAIALIPLTAAFMIRDPQPLNLRELIRFAPEAAVPAAPLPQTGLPTTMTMVDVWRIVRLPLAVGMAFAAQVMLYRTETPDQLQLSGTVWAGLVLWVSAIGLWYPTWKERIADSPLADTAARPAARSAARPVQWPFALAAAALSLVAFWAAGDHLYTPVVLFTWIVSSILWPLALLGGSPFVWAQRAGPWLRERLAAFDPASFQLRLSATTLAVIAIFAFGTFLRFHELNDVPREMTSDHVEKLTDVTEVLGGQYTIFFPRNTGREPFQFYWTAALMRYFDIPLSHMALKIGTALAGSITLIFVFLLARELGGTEVGLWTMLLTALARWPIALSRAGLRYPFAPLFVAPTFYFLVRGLKSGRRSDFVWAGIFAGIGLHGYTSFRVVPIIIAILIGLWLVWRWRSREASWQGLAQNGLALFSALLVVFVPLLRYALDDPQMFWFRVLSRVSTTEQLLPDEPLKLLVENMSRVLLMFNYTRDPVWTVNISYEPILSAMLAGLFGLGFVYLVMRAVCRDRWALLILITWLCLLLPSGLSLAFPNENPSVARTGAVVPFVLLIAAWPLALIRQTIVRHWPGAAGRLVSALGLFLLVGYIGQTELHDYFVRFRDQYALYATNPSEVGQAVRPFVAAGGSPDYVMLKGFPFWLDTRSVALESFDTLAWENSTMEVEDLARMGSDDQPKLFILNLYDRPAIAKLRELYPDGRLVYHTSKIEAHDFLTYVVPGTADLDENTLPPVP